METCRMFIEINDFDKKEENTPRAKVLCNQGRVNSTFGRIGRLFRNTSLLNFQELQTGKVAFQTRKTHLHEKE